MARKPQQVFVVFETFIEEPEQFVGVYRTAEGAGDGIVTHRDTQFKEWQAAKSDPRQLSDAAFTEPSYRIAQWLVGK